MSLRVWLPLNGDLRNQGLSTFNYATSIIGGYESGKIGQALSLLESNLFFTVPTLNNITEFSLAFWYKPRTNSNLTSNWCNIIALQTKSEDESITAYWRCESSYANSYYISHHNNTGDPIDGGHGSLVSARNVWYHICLTCDGISSTKAYVNGILKSTKVYNGGHLTGRIGIANEVDKPDGLLNDVRIYDHCLSLKQVQQISKGLVLHYKLDNNGMGGENLLLNSYGIIVDKTNNASGSRTEYFAWNVGSSYTNINKTTQVTISFDLYMYVNDFTVYSGQLLIYNTNNKGPVQLTTVSYHFKDEYEIGDTINKRIFLTTTLVPRSDATQTNNFIEFYTGYGSDNFYKISNVKLQLGSKATSWCPAKSELIDSNIIYDSSGYQNDGMIIGNVQTSSDSPKYTASAYINSGNVDYIISQNVIGNPEDAITMNIWFKSLNVTPGSDYHEIFNFATNSEYFEFAIYKTGLFRQGMRINGTRYVINGGSNLLDGNWHMLTATYDGTCIKRYIDGKNVPNMTQNISGTLNGANGKFLLGHYGSNTSYYAKDAYLSDARIYATALLEEDIKELYQTSALIDRNQNLYVGEVIE